MGIVAATLVLLSGLARLAPPLLAPARAATTYAIGINAAYWTFERALGMA